MQENEHAFKAILTRIQVRTPYQFNVEIHGSRSNPLHYVINFEKKMLIELYLILLIFRSEIRHNLKVSHTTLMGLLLLNTCDYLLYY